MDRRPFWIILIGVAFLLAISLWTMRTLLGPILSTAALCYILWPYRQNELVRRLLAVVLLLLFVWILSEARAIVYPALAALALAFLLDPAVNRLSGRRISRGLAALTIMLPLVGLLSLFILVLLPALVEQMRTLIERLPDAYETVRTWLQSMPGDSLRYKDIDLLPDDLSELLPSAEAVLKGLVSGLGRVGRGVAAVIQVASFLILTPILTYYILVDFDRLRQSIRPYLSPEWLARLQTLGAIFQESVGAWLKGQLLVALIIAVLLIAGFSLIGLPYALLLGVLAGVLNLIPILGFWVTLILCFAVALFAPQPLQMLLQTLVVLLVVQVIEANLLSPRIVGKQLGVKPVILLLSMLGMSIFLGVLGILLAAPAIGLARGIWALWGPRRRLEEQPEAAADGAG